MRFVFLLQFELVLMCFVLNYVVDKYILRFRSLSAYSSLSQQLKYSYFLQKFMHVCTHKISTRQAGVI